MKVSEDQRNLLIPKHYHHHNNQHEENQLEKADGPVLYNTRESTGPSFYSHQASEGQTRMAKGQINWLDSFGQVLLDILLDILCSGWPWN